MGISTIFDRPHELRQRDSAGAFSEGAERANVVTTNAITDGLIARKDEMAKRCEDQLKDLFANAPNSYGRARAVGMTASEAARLVDRAFQK